MDHSRNDVMYSTTILCTRRKDHVVLIGDGQVSLGSTVMKSTAKKLRKFNDGKIIGGFAGSTADAFTLFDRLEKKLEQYQGNLWRACIEMSKDWRDEKFVRNLEAMMIIADIEQTFVLTGNGDVLDPEGSVTAIGSGGLYALSAARALIDMNDVSLDDVARKSMKIAADICVYTNHNFVLEELKNTK